METLLWKRNEPTKEGRKEGNERSPLLLLHAGTRLHSGESDDADLL